MADSLEGRVAIVTGGGLGEGICATLAAEGAAVAAVEVAREEAERVAQQVSSNGALGIRRLEIAAPDAEGAARAVATLAESPGGTSLQLGTCALSLVASEESRRRVDTVGPGPFALELATDMPGCVEVLDRRLSQGVSIRLLEPAAGG